MEAPNSIARGMTPSGLKSALSFRGVELSLRDDDAMMSWPLQQRLVLEMVEQSVDKPKGRYQDGIQQWTAK